MAYITPQQAYHLIKFSRLRALQREFEIQRGEVVDDEFERATRPDEMELVSEKAERKGHIRI